MRAMAGVGGNSRKSKEVEKSWWDLEREYQWWKSEEGNDWKNQRKKTKKGNHRNQRNGWKMEVEKQVEQKKE